MNLRQPQRIIRADLSKRLFSYIAEQAVASVLTHEIEELILGQTYSYNNSLKFYIWAPTGSYFETGLVNYFLGKFRQKSVIRHYT